MLNMLGRIHSVSISEADVAELGRALASSPPHPDVPDSLPKSGRLSPGHADRFAGDPRSRPAAGGGLGGPLQQHFTGETTPETYQMVAQATGTGLSELWMIAAHP
jgi:2-haloacid dehalogenase